jgi:hypothetical protein
MTTDQYIGLRTDTFGANAGKGLVFEVSPLSNILEGLVEDGEQAKLKEFSVSGFLLDMNLLFTNFQGAYFILQTTAASLTASYNENHFIVDELFNSVCSDEFAAEQVSNWVQLKLQEATQYTTVQHWYTGYWRFNLPQKILRLLEKEQNTEHDQNLYLVFVGYSHEDLTSINLSTNLRIAYTRTSKQITIR